MTAHEHALDEVVARALQEDAFTERLVADPAATLAAEGVVLPEGVTFKVVEDTESVRSLVLPATADTLTDEEFAVAIGGSEPPNPTMGVSPWLPEN